MQTKNKPKNKTQKTQTGQTIVSRTKNSLAVLEKREKSINQRIEALQKRIDKVPKLSTEIGELRQKEMEILRIKQRQVVQKKEALLSEIRQIVASFASTVPAETPQVS